MTDSSASDRTVSRGTDTAGEWIEMAAIKLPDGQVLTVPRPGRHHNIIHAFAGDGAILSNQGFVTNHGRFLHRRAAWRIAEEAGQIIKQTGPKGTLFSEDLW